MSTSLRLALRFTRGATLALALAHAGAALADDLADEADLQFELGAELYRQHEFRGALEHFLASNRLVPNRNVLYNIARSYEQLQRYADAHRYYTQALEGETDAQATSSIREALRRIAPYVAVLRVQTEPPGATIYIDRRDLGPRGQSPRTLAFNPSTVRVITEMPGYEPATSPPVELRVGAETTVTQRLVRILGTLHVESNVPGARVFLDDEHGAPVGTAPCDVQAPPGRHRVILAMDGWQNASEEVEVVARETRALRVQMAPLTGTVLVSADERDALVEIDGRPQGFTPAVLNVPVGQRRVRVSLPGFRVIEQTATVSAGSQQRVDVSLSRIEEVSAASRAAESVEDAPSSVSVIPSQELRAMGYPTIAEALRGTRGVYLNDDRSYQSVGFRGFGRPGDYGNRVLVLLDGHPTNDNWVNSSYIGYDARSDIDDIERIEVVRGPGSVLYGTGAFSGVINLVTRGRDAPTAVNAGLSTNEYGVARARVGARWRANEHAGLWTSVSGAYGAGRDFFFPELVTPAMGTSPAIDGNSRDADGFLAGTFTGRAWWRDLTMQWLLHSREKEIPTGEYETQLGNARSVLRDTRGLIELRYEPRITRQWQLMTRAFVNHYRYSSNLATSADTAEDSRESFYGSWLGAEARVVFTPSGTTRVAVGGEGQFHLLATQYGQEGSARPYLNDDNHPYQIAAAYASVDMAPVSRFRFSLGGRFDYYRFADFNLTAVNPRVALIFRPYDRGNLKVMGGSAFRAPSIYELYYRGATQDPAGQLGPERIFSGEVEFTHRFSTTVSALVTGYANYITNLIALRPTAGDRERYENTASPVLTVGGEAEVRREWRQGWMLSAAYAYQRSSYLERGTGPTALREVPNAPEHLFSARAAAPLVPNLLTAMTRVTVEGPRWDRYDRASDPAQQRTDPAFVWDVVLSGYAERFGLRYNAGVYNLFDWRYAVPVSAEFDTRMRSVVQNGRTFLLSLSITR